MTIQEWFDKRKEAQIERRTKEMKGIDDINPDLWVKCVHCEAKIMKVDLEKNLMVCPHCDYHFRINAKSRIAQLFDENSFEEMFTNIKPKDALKFFDSEPYTNRIERAQAKTGLNDAVITGIGKIEGHKIATAVMDFDFMGGSMGSVVGEKVARIMEEAIKQRIPMLAITSSGGARMQESALSLMQMAKTACAVGKMDEEKILFINLLDSSSVDILLNLSKAILVFSIFSFKSFIISWGDLFAISCIFFIRSCASYSVSFCKSAIYSSLLNLESPFLSNCLKYSLNLAFFCAFSLSCKFKSISTLFTK